VLAIHRYLKNNNYLYFWLIGFSIFTLLVGYNCFRTGMFFDGLTYATISHNLANGIGSWFKLSYTKTVFPVFLSILP